MNWISRLERKYGRFCIPNLISIIVGGQILVYAIELFVNQFISVYLGLSRSLLLMGQVWRLITFVFIPFSGGGPLSVILGIYFTWFIGTALEKEWGDFRFNLYFLLGMIGTALGCLVTGIPADTYCLSLSLLLAFAMLYPEVQVLLFFVIPVRVKYFAIPCGTPPKRLKNNGTPSLQGGGCLPFQERYHPTSMLSLSGSFARSSLFPKA